MIASAKLWKYYLHCIPMFRLPTSILFILHAYEVIKKLYVTDEPKHNHIHSVEAPSEYNAYTFYN